jgi:hypothetical protein
MAVTFVQSTQVLDENGQNLLIYNYTTGVATGVTRDINTINCEIIGAQWRLPVATQQGLPLRANWAVAVDAVRPQPDAQKVLVVKEVGSGALNTYKIAIADTDYVGTTNVFGTLADGLGGTLATMPVVTISFPIVQNAPTSNTGGTNTFLFPFPANPNGLLYSIPFPWFNGVAPTPAYAPTGITTPAGFVTWANTNWGTYGTWTSSGNIVTLSSPSSAGTPVTKAGFYVNVTQAAWCIDATALYSPGQIATTSLNAGGTGYVVNDTFTITGGTQLATGHVTAVSGGVVTTYTIDTQGVGYAVATGAATVATSGSGTGLKINILTLQTAAPATVNGVGFGTGTPATFGAFTLNDSTTALQQLITAITPFFENGATFAIGGADGDKITINTVQATPKIYNGASVILTATSGACS